MSAGARRAVDLILIGAAADTARVYEGATEHRSARLYTRWVYRLGPGGAGRGGPGGEREEVVEMRGLEPLTPAMRTQCSPS